MTVHDLIEKLKSMPQDMEVWMAFEKYACQVETVQVDQMCLMRDIVLLE